MNWNTSKDAEESQGLFAKGSATSFNMSLEPNNLITATIEGNFYDKLGIGMSATDRTFPGKIVGGAGRGKGGGGLPMAHASTSGPDDVAALGIGFSGNPFNVTYAASRGLSPIYTLGQLTPAFIMPTDPQESISMQGDNLPKKLVTSATKPLCLEAINLSFEVNDVCLKEVYSKENIKVCGFIQSRDIAVATDDVLRGNITVIDYNYPQVIG